MQTLVWILHQQPSLTDQQDHRHCCAGDLRGQRLGMHTASTNSLQYAHEEGVNGVGALPHPGHVRTASVADSGDDATHAAGVFFWVLFTHLAEFACPDEPLQSPGLT